MRRRVLLVSAALLVGACDVMRGDSGATDSRGVRVKPGERAADDCYVYTPNLGPKQDAATSGAIGRRPRDACRGLRAEGRVADRSGESRGLARSRSTTGARMFGIEEFQSQGGDPTSGARRGATVIDPGAAPPATANPAPGPAPQH